MKEYRIPILPVTVPSPENARLSPKEKDVMVLWCEGKAEKEIADAVHCSVQTVKYHKSRIRTKTGLADAVSLARWWKGEQLTGMDLWDRLTDREKEIAALYCAGWNEDQVAKRVGLSRATIGTKLQVIERVLDVDGRRGLIVLMAQTGRISTEKPPRSDASPDKLIRFGRNVARA